MDRDIENKMLIDGYWPDYESEDEQEDAWERFCRMADEQYDDMSVGYFDGGGVLSYRV